jgi:V-type H+-transporting ATPase subunit E
VDWSDKSFAVLLQTDHDFNLERQNLVHAGKQRVQEEYAQKAKDLEIQQRV